MQVSIRPLPPYFSPEVIFLLTTTDEESNCGDVHPADEHQDDSDLALLRDIQQQPDGAPVDPLSSLRHLVAVRDARRRGEDIPLLVNPNVNSRLPVRTRVPSPTGNQAGPSRPPNPPNPPRRLTEIHRVPRMPAPITDNDVEAAERKAVATHAIAAEATPVAEKEALELDQQAAKQARAPTLKLLSQQRQWLLLQWHVQQQLCAQLLQRHYP